MVSLAGAEAAQPFVVEIQNLQAAVNALATAIANNNASIIRIRLDYLDNNSKLISIDIQDVCNTADTAAILNDIRNILANKINIQTNALGQIV